MNFKNCFYLFLLILLSLPFTTFAQNNNVEDFFQQSEILIKQEKYVEAFDVLTKILDADSHNVEALDMAVEQIDNLQIDADRTYALLEKIKTVVKEYRDPIFYYYLGNLYENLKFILEAKDAYNEANLLNKDNKISFLNGKLLTPLLTERLNGINRSIADLEQGVGKIDFTSEEGRKKAAQSCLRAVDQAGENIDEGIICATSAIYLTPDDPGVAKAYFWMGSFMVYGGSLDFPQKYYSKAILLDPSFVEGYETIADFFQMIKEKFPEKWASEKKTELYGKTINALKKEGKVDLVSKIVE